MDVFDSDCAMQVGLEPDVQHLLAAKNDGSHFQGVFQEAHDFNQIADYIEENL